MTAAATVHRRGQSGARPRATYQDVLDAPAHRVAEIVDGSFHTPAASVMPVASWLRLATIGCALSPCVPMYAPKTPWKSVNPNRSFGVLRAYCVPITR